VSQKQLPSGSLVLWQKTAEACERCLTLDRQMAGKVTKNHGHALGRLEVEEYLDPALWEHYVQARRDLFDFTVTGIEVLTQSGSDQKKLDKSNSDHDPTEVNPASGHKATPKAAHGEAHEEAHDEAHEAAEIEKRLMSSLSEMLALEEKLTGYLAENLEVLKQTIEDLTKNQPLFSKYSRQNAKPDPGYLSSQI
jgi:hypothetical protein